MIESINRYLENNKLNIINCNKRSWGEWCLIDNSHMEYDKKILRVNPGMLLSLQYHGRDGRDGHLEIWEAFTKIRAIIGRESVVGKSDLKLDDLLVLDINTGGSLIIGPGFVHGLGNPFSSDIYVIETRESQIVESSTDRELNITRIYDQADRAPPFPPHLVSRFMENPDIIVNDGEIFDSRILSKKINNKDNKNEL